MENKGYTLAGLAGRLQKAEKAWLSYTAAQLLAITKGWKKSTLETKVFGQDKASSTFRNCWKLAEKVFASAFHAGHRETVVTMELDDALNYAVDVLEKHMTALGVRNQKDYTAIAHFAGVEEKEAAEAIAKADQANAASAERQAEAPATEAEAAVEPGAKPKSSLAESNPMELAVAAMMALSQLELIEFGAKVQARLTDLDQAQELPLAA